MSILVARSPVRTVGVLLTVPPLESDRKACVLVLYAFMLALKDLFEGMRVLLLLLLLALSSFSVLNSPVDELS